MEILMNPLNGEDAYHPTRIQYFVPKCDSRKMKSVLKRINKNFAIHAHETILYGCSHTGIDIHYNDLAHAMELHPKIVNFIKNNC